MDGHLLFLTLTFFVPEIPAQVLSPPTLMVNPAVISETDSVSLHCQAPPSVSAYQCYFYTGKQETTRGFSCVQNLTAPELLLMSRLSSPAEVKVRCFYTVKYEDLNSPSLHSNPSSIMIQSQTPQMSVQHFDGEYVLITCSLPGPVKDNTKCNLYFGEAVRPAVITTVRKESSSITNQRFCQFYVKIDDFLRHLHFVQQKEASCDYSLQSEANSLSPRSDAYNLKAIVEKESPKTIPKSAAPMNTEPSPTTHSAPTPTTSVSSSSVAANLSPVTNVTSAVTITKRITTGDRNTESSLSHPNTSTASTSVNSPSGNSTDTSHKTNPTVTFTTVKGLTHASTHNTALHTSEGQTLQQPGNKANPVSTEASLWKLSVAVTGFGATVGVMLLVLGLLTSKRRTGPSVCSDERYSQKRTKNSTTGDVIRMRKNKHGGMLSAGNTGASGVITSLPADRCLNSVEKLNWKETKNEDVRESDIYHVYATIAEEQAVPEPQDMIYSMLQAH